MFDSLLAPTALTAPATHALTVSNIFELEDPITVSVPATESMSRLIEFLALEDNWDGDGSLAPSFSSIFMGLRLFLDLHQLASNSTVYPSVDGGILIEWRYRSWAYSLRFLNDESIEFFGIGLENEEETDEIGLVFGEYDEIKALVQKTLSG